MNGLTISAICGGCNKTVTFLTTDRTNSIQCACGVNITLTINENGAGVITTDLPEREVEPMKPETKPARRVSKKQVQK